MRRFAPDQIHGKNLVNSIIMHTTQIGTTILLCRFLFIRTIINLRSVPHSCFNVEWLPKIAYGYNPTQWLRPLKSHCYYFCDKIECRTLFAFRLCSDAIGYRLYQTREGGEKKIEFLIEIQRDQFTQAQYRMTAPGHDMKL